ncbi:extensin-2-like [Abrus precatorius]|uniref:Extensin-2-like n=1 Tax=Abrus precatorius TaxID=3816 RepID=A0A8B8MLX7_ABRPR|nr:extensin-2-like [Abrus precatorius]
MFPPKFLPVVVVVTLSLLESNFHFEAYGDELGDVIPSPSSCENCSKCDPPCQQQVNPPLSGYPSYGASSPPSPPSGYYIYGAPPPPHEAGHTKCPPATGAQCCTPPAPYTYGYGYGPPNPYYAPPNLYAPPNPYTYVPYGEGHGHASMILPILVPLTMFFSSFIFLV